MMTLKIRIATFRKIESEHERNFTVFYIEVFHGDKLVGQTEKRYSEFEELNKQLKSSLLPPPLPPKTVLKWNQKMLKNRCQGLQNYLQTIIDGGYIPKSLLQFLEVNTLDNLTSIEDNGPEDRYDLPNHQGMIGFVDGAYLDTNTTKGSLPDILVVGVTQAIYGSAEDMHR